MLGTFARFLRFQAPLILQGDPETFDEMAQNRKERQKREVTQKTRRLVQDQASIKAVVQRRKNTSDEPSAQGSQRAQVLPDADRLVLLDQVEQAAMELLAASMKDEDPEKWREIATQLKPGAEDYQRLFVDRAVDSARQAYSLLWGASIPPPVPSPGQTQLRVAACYAEWLPTNYGKARRFPEGYRSIGHLLKPGTVWLVWKYFGRGDPQGSIYDGLVWLDGKFFWLPEPYEILAGL